LAIAVTGRPPELRTSQVFGGVSSVIVSVARTRRGPTRRVTTALEPISTDSPSARTDTTLPCQRRNRAESATTPKTSSGLRGIAIVSVATAITPSRAMFRLAPWAPALPRPARDSRHAGGGTVRLTHRRGAVRHQYDGTRAEDVS